MAEQAIILIPDVSGFTDFTTTTEIDHAAHIITELLELIVESNDTEFTLAEIEGDAVLFYRKGDPLSPEQLVDQCLRTFSRFHRQLMVIERDAFCQCGACQTASSLTLAADIQRELRTCRPRANGACWRPRAANLELLEYGCETNPA